jgi:hypothetical protein
VAPDTSKQHAKHKQALSEINRLTQPGVLGFYTHFDVAEVFVTCPGEKTVRNVLSIWVAEERSAANVPPPHIQGKRIELASLKGWKFGLMRSVLPLSRLAEVVAAYWQNGIWQVADKVLEVGPLTPNAARFVPSDSTECTPLNRILKNNFWNGSYLIEWVDTEKAALKPLLDDPRALLELSSALSERIAISIATVSDRIGNIVVQLPVTVLIASFGSNRGKDVTVDLAWHPNVTPRVLRASCEMRFDNMIAGYASAEASGNQAILQMPTDIGEQRSVVWDDQNHVVLAATNGTQFFDSITMGLRVPHAEPRAFTLHDERGQPQKVTVGLIDSSAVHAESPDKNRTDDWAKRRIYRAQVERLAAERKFVQYRPDLASASNSRAKALNDIRFLLSAHGEHGAWLWDPYLNAQDVLSTLFYCPHSGADLRALTAGLAHAGSSPKNESRQRLMRTIARFFARAFGAPRRQAPTATELFIEKQRETFKAARSNLRGLRLEYRISIGPVGWAFHDRFLIFPRTAEGPLAWSLGTSVNSLGKQHHLLQRVDDAQLVANAFSDLWDALIQPRHQIWKVP